MTMTSADPILGDVLIALCRSLLQYVGEAWPWTDAHSAAQRDLMSGVHASDQPSPTRQRASSGSPRSLCSTTCTGRGFAAVAT